MKTNNYQYVCIYDFDIAGILFHGDNYQRRCVQVYITDYENVKRLVSQHYETSPLQIHVYRYDIEMIKYGYQYIYDFTYFIEEEEKTIHYVDKQELDEYNIPEIL